MAKRFKLRISRVFPSLIQSCRSKDPSTLPENPVPVFLRLDSPADPPPPPQPPSKPHRNSFKRHVSSAIVSVGCGLRSRSCGQCLSDEDDGSELPEFKWKKEDEWHVVAKVYDDVFPRRKIYNSSVSGESDDDALPPSPPPPRPPAAEKKKRRGKKKRAAFRVRMSTSSADSGLFSSDCGDEEKDGEETETLVSSSRSFSTDSSSEFNPQLETIREAPAKKKKKKKGKRTGAGPKGGESRRRKAKAQTRSGSASSPGNESPARLSMFQRLIPCTVEGKVRESFAVVKKSEDPYEDFKRSMMEMVVEKQMFEEKDLEQLLHCFLSLNSRRHHRVIVDAFTDIWEVLFSKPPTRTHKPLLLPHTSIDLSHQQHARARKRNEKDE